MGLTTRIDAAAVAVQVHTHALGIDDDGDAAGIGAWHLLYALHSLCESKGMAFPEVRREATESAPFLIMVASDGRVAPGLPSCMEYEVYADTLAEACAKVAGPQIRRVDAERRNRFQHYGDLYAAPDWDAYSGGAIIEVGSADAKRGLQLATNLEWLPKHPEAVLDMVRILNPEIDTAHGDLVESARVAVRVYGQFLGHDPSETAGDIEALVVGLQDYLARSGEDYESMLDDVRSERQFNGLPAVSTGAANTTSL